MLRSGVSREDLTLFMLSCLDASLVYRRLSIWVFSTFAWKHTTLVKVALEDDEYEYRHTHRRWRA